MRPFDGRGPYEAARAAQSFSIYVHPYLQARIPASKCQLLIYTTECCTGNVSSEFHPKYSYITAAKKNHLDIHTHIVYTEITEEHVQYIIDCFALLLSVARYFTRTIESCSSFRKKYPHPYLPIQKSLKSTSNMSSTATRPVSRPR